MDFGLGETEAMVATAVRELVAGTVREAAEAWDRDASFPAEALQAVAAQGLLGILLDETAGGAGLDAQTLAVVAETLADGDAGLAQTVVEHNAVLLALQLGWPGDEAAVQVANAIAGTWPLACGWEDGAAAARATLLDDGGAVLSGHLPLVCSAEAAVAAGTLLVFARDEAGAPVLCCLNARAARAEGLRASQTGPLVGMRSARFAAVTLEGVAVPASGVLRGDEARSVFEAARTVARIGSAAVALGTGTRALRAGVQYAAERTQFGKPIERFQPIQWMQADSATALDAARVLSQGAAFRYDTATTAGRGLAPEVHRAAAQARLRAAEAAQQTADHAIQIHGGYGYTRDFPVERAWRDATVAKHVAGDPAALRAEIAASLIAALG
jgi:alkylation response protein AidB-like acyl-CoA dehydrogenase